MDYRNRGNMHRALKKGYLNATEFADYLVGKGIPFREAHRISGSAVALAESRGAGLEDLSLEDLRSLSPVVGDDVYAVLDYRNAVERRNTHGGTGPKAVEEQLESMRSWLSAPGGSR